MREESPDLTVEHADQLTALWNAETQKLFGRQDEGVFLIHRGYVIETIEISDRLQIGLVLDQLFGAAVQEADMRINPLDHFAVEFQHKAQHAMRCRMLRPKVDGEALDLRLGRRGRCGGGHGLPPSFAFSSPGSTCVMPSHGDRKSKLRNSCFSLTGS